MSSPKCKECGKPAEHIYLNKETGNDFRLCTWHHFIRSNSGISDTKTQRRTHLEVVVAKRKKKQDRINSDLMNIDPCSLKIEALKKAIHSLATRVVRSKGNNKHEGLKSRLALMRKIMKERKINSSKKAEKSIRIKK